MNKKGNRYSDEFKAKTLRYVDAGMPVSRAARKVGVAPNTVAYWIDQRHGIKKAVRRDKSRFSDLSKCISLIGQLPSAERKYLAQWLRNHPL